MPASAFLRRGSPPALPIVQVGGQEGAWGRPCWTEQSPSASHSPPAGNPLLLVIASSAHHDLPPGRRGAALGLGGRKGPLRAAESRGLHRGTQQQPREVACGRQCAISEGASVGMPARRRVAQRRRSCIGLALSTSRSVQMLLLPRVIFQWQQQVSVPDSHMEQRAQGGGKGKRHARGMETKWLRMPARVVVGTRRSKPQNAQ